MNLNDLYQKTNLTEGEQNYGPEWDEKVRRLGQMAAQGPRKTVWDPVKRVYKTVPVNAPKKEQGVAEGAAETVPMQYAQKVLNHYGADYFKTTHDTLYFSKYRKQFSIGRIRDDDSASAGSVNLSDLNAMVRKLRGMRVPLSPFGEGSREMTGSTRDQFISTMTPRVDHDALMQKVAKVVNSPEFDSDTILKIVDAGDTITHPVGQYIQKEFDELQYDLGRQYEDYPEQVAEKLLSMLKDRTTQGVAEDDGGRDKFYYQRNNIWRVMDGDELVHEYTPDRYEVVGAKKLLARFDDEGYDVTHVISPMGVVTYLYGKPDMDEGVAEGDVEEFLHKVAQSGDNGYDMLYDAQQGKYGQEIERAVQDMYDDITIDTGYHGDDDFEQIYDRMLDNIEADYGQQGLAEGGQVHGQQQWQLPVKPEVKPYTPGTPLPQSLQQRLNPTSKPNTGRAVDDKGWTQRDWIDAVKRKFPGAKIIQSKMIDGPCQVTLPNGKTLHWAPAQGIAKGLNEFVTPQATTQDPGLEREKDVDVIFFGRMPQDFTADTAWAALEEVLPREYPAGSQRAQNKIAEVADRGGAVVTNKPLSIAQKLVKTFQTYGIKCKIDAPGLEEGDNPWGDQGNFAGDKPVNVGGVSMKNIQTGDAVRYLEQPAKVVAMSKDRKHSRITITKGMGGVTQDVLTSDLQQLGRGMSEADEQPPADPFKSVYPRVNKPQILGTQKKKLDKPLPESTGSRYHANRTGFARGTRDPEGQDPQVGQPVWGLKINGKVCSKDGKDVTFTSKEAALKTRNAILKNRPDLEIGLVTRGGMSEGWKERLGAAALTASMALGATGANARVTPDGQGGFTGGIKPSPTVVAPDTAPAKAEAPQGFSKEYLQKAADPNRTGRYMISVARAQELLNGMKESIESLSRIAELAGVPHKDNLLEYGASGSRALGTANFALLHRAYVNKRPKLSRNLRLEFGPNQAVDLDQDDIEAVAAHYDALPADQDRYNFVYDTMSRGDKFTALLRQLGRRGDLIEQDSKKKSNSPLDRKDVNSVSLNNALRTAYAKYPQAKSDIEALALSDLNYQKDTSQDLSIQTKTNQRQDSVDNQLKTVARQQSSKISDLDQENDELSAELDQLNQEINDMAQQVGITPKDSDKPSNKPSVINLNVGDRSEKSQQRQADVKQRDVQKSEPAVTTSPAMGQVAQSLATPPAPTIDVIDKPAVALPAKMGAAPAVPDSDGGEQLSMFGPEPEAVVPNARDTVDEPPAEVPSTMAATDADEPDELPANVSDLDKARRTRDQLRQATRDQALNPIKTGTFESRVRRSLFSSLLVMESAKENHRNLVCEMCGRTAADHPFKHPFKVSSK